MATKPNEERVYRVVRGDGELRGGGYDGRGPRKLWKSAADLMRHFRLTGYWDDSPEELVRKAGAKEDTVIEYRLHEVSRVSALEFVRSRVPGADKEK